MEHPDKQLKAKSEGQGMENSTEQGEGSRMVCLWATCLVSKKACPATQESAQFSHLVLGFRESKVDFVADLSIIKNQDGISDTMALEALGCLLDVAPSKMGDGGTGG